MNMFKHFTAIALAVAIFSGCSAETKQEAKEALEATGEAASAAVEDTKKNVDKAAEAIDARINTEDEPAGETTAEPPAGDSPADADAIPESEKPQP
jgi:hypothetical protein